MIGFLLMLAILIAMIYLMFFKLYPSIFFRWAGGGDRKARAEYGRIKRENPDSPQAKISEAEFVENFIKQSPHPVKYIVAILLLLIVGLPMSCVIGIAGLSN